MEYIVNDFIKRVVEELKDKNNERQYEQKTSINMPFVISALYQHLQDEEFKPFLEDLSKHDYNIIYIDTNEGWYNYGKLHINLWEDDSSIEYSYTINLSYDERSWGYCECEIGDDDYREDKGCCGHGCDWSAPAFNLIKEINLGYKNWDGDEHDYWNFEDEFYKSDEELAEEKERRDKENKIKYLEQQIKEMQIKLNELK